MATLKGVYYRKASRRPITPVYHLMAEPGASAMSESDAAVDYLFEVSDACGHRLPDESATYVRNRQEVRRFNLARKRGQFWGLTPIFLDRAALFRSELCKGSGDPDRFGRVMLQDQELVLAINAAFSYIAPDRKLTAGT